MIYDVLIIGAGVTGVMTASKLSALSLNGQPLKIAVAEAKEDVASGASKANSGIVHAGFDALPGTLKAELNVSGAAQMPALAERFGVAYEACGSLVVGFDETDRKTLQTLLDRGLQNGVEKLRIVEQDELHQMEPNLSKEAMFALDAPTAGVISPYSLAIAAADNAVLNGVSFFFEFPVDTVTRHDDIFSVFSSDRELSAKYVINAAGVHADHIADLLGESDFPARIIPRRGEYMILDRNMGGLVNHTLFVCPSSKGKGILVSPTADRNIIIGPNANQIDDPDDTSTTAEGLDEIFLGALRLVPSLTKRSVITSFSGVRATPACDDFYIAASSIDPHFIHAAGIESPGMVSSPATADYLIKLLKENGLSLVPRSDYVPYTRKSRTVPRLFRDCTDAQKAALIAKNPAYGRIICRCETITEGDILDAIHAPIPAQSLDMIKHRVRAGMGRCQGGFCSVRIAELLASEHEKSLKDITKCGGNSKLLFEETK